MAVLMALLTGGPAGDPPGATPRVRAESTEVRALIDEASSRSPTVRDLIARLNCTDVIVYVEITSSPQVPTARTKLVTTVNGARFIRIGIHMSIAERDRAPLFAHEMQHAVEIAEQFDVRDDDGVRRLFAKIGRSGGHDSFETDEARKVEWIVRSELRRKIGG